MLSSYRLAVPLSAMLIALTGCSTPLMATHSPTLPAPEGQQALMRAADRCASLASLPYQPLTAQETLTLNFAPPTPAHDFGDGKSFFHAFELPRNDGPIALNVSSSIRDGQVLAPTILVLDANFQPVRKVSSESLQLRRPTGFTPARLEGQFSLSPGPNAQYVVIYTSDEDRRASTAYESEEKAYARVRGLAEPAGPDPRAVHAATGEIALEVTSLAVNSGMTPLMGDTPARPPENTAARSPANAPASNSSMMNDAATSGAATNEAADFDYRRMIDAALKAEDVELALDLAERAERNGHPGTRAWLAERLQAKTP